MKKIKEMPKEIKEKIKKIEIPKTAKEIRVLIIWAMSEIDQYRDFIKLCEKQIADCKDENHNETTKRNKRENRNS